MSPSILQDYATKEFILEGFSKMEECIDKSFIEFGEKFEKRLIEKIYTRMERRLVEQKKEIVSEIKGHIDFALKR
jgi:hypothetical protein